MRPFTRVEDIYSDPDLLGVSYRIGRSAFFEATALSGDFNESQAHGDLAGNPATTASAGGGGGIGGSSSSGPGGTNPGNDYGGGTTGDDGGFHCPEKNQWVWVEEGFPTPIRAGLLPFLIGTARLFNPLTGNFNLLTHAELIKDQPLVTFQGSTGCNGVTSTSHKYIKNTADRNGMPLRYAKLGDELLRFEKKSRNLYIDEFTVFGYLVKGDVVEISLEKESIYIHGSSKLRGFLAHNIKNEGDFDRVAV